MIKAPRERTRARAVYDLLEDGQEHRWKELFAAYMYAKEPWSNPHYISLTLGRLLKRIATRVRRGVYVRKLEGPTIVGPFQRPEAPPVIHSASFTEPLPVRPPPPPQTGNAEIEDMPWGGSRGYHVGNYVSQEMHQEAMSMKDEEIEIQSRLIDNQLKWITKLEEQVGKLQSKLGEIAMIAECE